MTRCSKVISSTLLGAGAGGFFAGQLSTSLGLSLPHVFCLTGSLVFVTAIVLRLVYKLFAQKSEDKIVRLKKQQLNFEDDKPVPCDQVTVMKF